jgi:hypothetical protein
MPIPLLPPDPSVPPAEESPIFKAGWWKSKKFIGAVTTSVVSLAVSAATGALVAAPMVVLPLCLAPILAFLGVEGLIDLKALPGSKR